MKGRQLSKFAILTLLLCVTVAGCGKRPEPAPTPPPGPPDQTTTASVASDEDAFEKAVGKDGSWIILVTKDLTIDKELTLEGTFTNGKKDEAGQDEVQRKIALYTQDEDRNVKDRFTLEIPKLTIKSPEALLQGGTLKGDLMVESENFRLVDMTVEGDVLFSDETIKASFEMDEDSEVSGKQEVQSQ